MTTSLDALRAVRRSTAPGVDAAPATARAAVRPNIAHYLGLAAAIEWELRDALILVAERHERNYEVSHGATTLAAWSADHLDWLREPVARYGMSEHEGPPKLRAALLSGKRVGRAGELADIADLAVLVEQASMAWTILVQGAKELHDQGLLEIASSAREHSRRQLAWLRTQIEHEAPDAIAVAADPLDQAAVSLPKRMTSIASIPDAAWGPLAAGFLVLAVGAMGLLVGRPWLLPSLGPTAVLLATDPAHPTARPWNVLVGHMAGLATGFAAVLVLGATTAPTVLGDGQLAPVRVAAATVAVALTIIAGSLTRAKHPPAAATALLVALGSIATFEQAMWVVGGAATIALLAALVRTVRTVRTAPSERDAPADSAASSRLRGPVSSKP
jgi:hypothetical protein